MLRILFFLLVLFHGLIHAMGFAKAYELAKVEQLTLPISKPWGLVWLFAAVVLLLCALAFVFKKEGWFFIAFVGIAVSQLLIVAFWADAKYGTLANIIMLLVSVVAWGQWNFNNTAHIELKALQQAAIPDTSLITEAHIAHLPPVVQKWLQQAQVLNKPICSKVYLTQSGAMRTSPAGKWIPFTAQQWFSTKNPAFLWLTEVNMAPGIFLSGRDKYENGKGHMLIKAMSLLPVADAKGPETDQGTMLRFLGEMVWFPSAAVNDYVQWEQLDSTSAKATMTYKGVSASGIYHFTPDGDVQSFAAKRYYDRKNMPATLEDWFINIDTTAYKTFEQGIRIPTKSGVIWKLKEGDFNWLNLEITNITYNNAAYDSTP